MICLRIQPPARAAVFHFCELQALKKRDTPFDSQLSPSYINEPIWMLHRNCKQTVEPINSLLQHIRNYYCVHRIHSIL
ncbi:hypothetical protein J4772_11265 [Cohnella sp. LGH]|uniref:hypothetical protein n=1 Tax=Cohnella sp. LGH TaxID=1619153 RepID=UPI001ADBFD5D|nr:hypothetical protein [Cohnella sp. LGH]QTH44922.1 hypothetical protein J4772_11265 [Cohnella sp. LGH]